ncbi:LysM peptidoglycan-binding domain-containing protein [Phycicoccus flavus]|uniref:LysM peptidoglycan-binding domain-containing protein n=1 Tax=Phycicoccus flavus TaxID=2502783 RepID=A0A8T6R5X3_9MICO|nr:LysM peptidoglycan-binding domain-containing protein [Phycicoccus flavus]NHA68225.1 LysM peptidoglycan-binding domain-containing protein [Phycicoccus flavus]
MTPHPQPTSRDRLTGLAATLAIITVVAGIPLTLTLIGATPNQWRLPSRDGLLEVLTGPDTGALALAAVTLVAWAAWAALTLSLVLEGVARARGARPPHLPGLALPQAAAHGLVGAALLLFVAGPTAVAPPAAAAAPVAAHVDTVAVATSLVETAAPAAPHHGPATTSETPEARRHTVARGESLWSIAADELGDPTRWPEIAALNPTASHGPDHTLWTGTLLRLPPLDAHPAADSHAAHYTVRTGDTLSGIAHDRLGDPDRWPDIYTGSTHTVQPDGRHLSDPDLILPGWHLTLPATPDASPPTARQRPPLHAVPDPSAHEAPVAPASPTTGMKRAEPNSSLGGAPQGPPAPSQSPTADPRTLDPTDAGHGTSKDTAEPDPAAAPWILTGLAGGTVLTGSMWTLLRRRRAAQARHRRPGRTLPTPPAVLAPVEKTLATLGPTTAPDVAHLDAVLRHLASTHARTGTPMPAVAAVELGPAGVTLHLDQPAQLPAPWQDHGDATTWRLPAGTQPADLGDLVPDQPAPYPLLVTIGTSDTGEVWLYNCEDLALALTGDPDYAGDYARYLAAEIACNPWSEHVHLDCVGVAAEVAPLNPDRLHPHPAGDDHPVGEVLAAAVATIDRASDLPLDVTTARAHAAGPDAWPARILLLDAATIATDGDLPTLLDLLAAHTGGTGTSVVLTGTSSTGVPASAVTVDLTPTGRARIDRAGLDLVAVGLTPDEARGCAALLAAGTDHTDTPIPVDDSTTDSWHAFTDAAGALRAQHTLPRDTPTTDLPEGADSILDAPYEDYLTAAATTRHDLAALAPHVTPDVRTALEDADPDLDADLHAWFSDDCPLPRLTLLGPVRARTRGTALRERKAYMTAVLAYLATRPHGATPEELADAFGVSPTKARAYAGTVRDWLGTNPRTGQPHLPDARLAPATRTRGVPVYQVQDVLVDADLFRRLRARGQARGNAGIDDLVRALDLVTGQPFSQLRPGAWAWLYDGDRLDQHLVCAVVDVAHIVTIHALHTGDTDTARHAAETAHQAAPEEDTPYLDLAAVAEAMGDLGRRDEIVKSQLLLSCADGLPPADLSQRTERLMRARRWSGSESATG